MQRTKDEKQAQGLILSKSSTPGQVKQYFNEVLRLKNTGKDFPVNLEDVWPILYHDKKKAVQELTKTKDGFGNSRYMQDVDYQISPQKGENPKGGRPVDVYRISVSCMEFLIARKVRPVFEVYRQVFHNAINGISLADRKWTPYRKFIAEMGVKFSPYSLAARRGNHPSEFLYINSTWYISAEYADYLRKQMEVTGYKETFRNKKFMLNKKNGR